MMCDDTFTCATEVHILNYHIQGAGYFVLMLFIALLLQIAANFIWIQSSQATRELLQKPISERGSAFDFSTLMGKNVMWTIISTIVWIARIILVMGSNLYIFIIVLVGNVAGIVWTSSRQKRDHIDYLADDIFTMIRRKNTCDITTKAKIMRALKALKEELRSVDRVPYSDTELPEQITF